jgi:hypothetical protein
MRNEGVFNNRGVNHASRVHNRPYTYIPGLNIPKRAVIGLILFTALIAFEVFNFDTTRYALQNLLGDVSFLRVSWAAILATAFCAIDFAGLARLFTPEQGYEEPKAVWYLMGAWLLGATMNAMMTWWAISLTLLSHEFGNEVLNREQLLQTVPIFVATLVWLTRILLIGSFSVAGEYIFATTEQRSGRPIQRPIMAQPAPMAVAQAAPPMGSTEEGNEFLITPPVRRQRPDKDGGAPAERPQRIRQRPPIPERPSPMPVGMQARNRNR